MTYNSKLQLFCTKIFGSCQTGANYTQAWSHGEREVSNAPLSNARRFESPGLHSTSAGYTQELKWVRLRL